MARADQICRKRSSLGKALVAVRHVTVKRFPPICFNNGEKQCAFSSFRELQEISGFFRNVLVRPYP
eukprot:16450610-Heterocapsa_arctica.AAC.1